MKSVPSAPSRDQRGIWHILWIVIPWIIIVNAFALLAWNRFAVQPDTAYGWISPSVLHASSWNITGFLVRWDAEWYLDIAKHGYQFQNVHDLSNVVFFPLYPMLIRLLGTVLLSQFAIAGWLVSLAALIGATIMLAKLVREFHPKVDAEDVVFFLLIFPTAIFLDVVYTESLFLLLSVSAIYFARKKQFGLASLIGMAAALTRVTGVLLFIPIVMEFVSAVGWKRVLQPRALWPLLVPAGTFSFFAFHAIRFGDPLLFFKIEKAWGRSFAYNPDHFAALTHLSQANLALDIGFFLFAVVMVVILFRSVRPSYAAYALATILVAVSTGTLMSIGRYILVLFPMFIALASMPATWKRSWTLVSILLFGMYTTLYALGYWAG